MTRATLRSVKAILLAGALLLIATDGGSQTSAAQFANFETISTSEKRAYLVSVVRHQKTFNPIVMAVALRDADARIRELALAAVSSQLLGPVLVKDDASILKEWEAARPAILALRDQLEILLQDDVEAVRVQAMGALVALDKDRHSNLGD